MGVSRTFAGGRAGSNPSGLPSPSRLPTLARSFDGSATACTTRRPTSPSRGTHLALARDTTTDPEQAGTEHRPAVRPERLHPNGEAGDVRFVLGRGEHDASPDLAASLRNPSPDDQMSDCTFRIRQGVLSG
jgi:hypothetical protein